MNDLFPRIASHRDLRDYQLEALELLRRSIGEGRRRPMLQAPTAFGKTVLASEIIARALAKGKRVAFTVPRVSLVDQAMDSFAEHGIFDVAPMQANHPLTDPDMPVQVVSIQTLKNRRSPDADLVIFDEAHQFHETHKRWMAEPRFAKVPFIGLSATPWTKGLGRFFDHLICTKRTQQLIDDKHLSDFRVFAPSHPDLSSVKVQNGDYQVNQLSAVMSKAPLVADIVETWCRLGEGRPTLCYGVDRAHAKHIQARFEAAGIRCEYIDGDTERSERLDIKKRFHNGDTQVVSSVGTLTTGIDWDVRCIILGRPTKSEMLHVQIIGRGLRTAEGKDFCIILDHADNHARLGFVTDIHHTDLDDGKPKSKSASEEGPSVPLPKECPKCSFLRPAKIHKCPSCGFEPQRQSNVQTIDGELVELRPGKGPKVKAGHVRMQDREIPYAQFFGMLKRHSRERGYASGWASNQFREVTGVWPNHYKNVPECPIGYEVASWIKSRAIAYAQRQKKLQTELVHA